MEKSVGWILLMFPGRLFSTQTHPTRRAFGLFWGSKFAGNSMLYSPSGPMGRSPRFLTAPPFYALQSFPFARSGVLRGLVLCKTLQTYPPNARAYLSRNSSFINILAYRLRFDILPLDTMNVLQASIHPTSQRIRLSIDSPGRSFDFCHHLGTAFSKERK